MFYLYWDESDENDDSYSKIRRAAYATKAEAVAQATHDLLCGRCRVLDGGKATLVSTGIEPLDPEGKAKCRDCGGSKLLASRRILRVEEISDAKSRAFHVESKGVASPSLPSGEVVWEPEDAQASGS